MTAPGRVRWTSLEVIVALELKRTRALSKSLIPSKPVSAQKHNDDPRGCSSRGGEWIEAVVTKLRQQFMQELVDLLLVASIHYSTALRGLVVCSCRWGGRQVRRL